MIYRMVRIGIAAILIDGFDRHAGLALREIYL